MDEKEETSITISSFIIPSWVRSTMPLKRIYLGLCCVSLTVMGYLSQFMFNVICGIYEWLNMLMLELNVIVTCHFMGFMLLFCV
jgi:hypothetical protein